MQANHDSDVEVLSQSIQELAVSSSDSSNHIFDPVNTDFTEFKKYSSFLAQANFGDIRRVMKRLIQQASDSCNQNSSLQDQLASFTQFLVKSLLFYRIKYYVRYSTLSTKNELCLTFNCRNSAKKSAKCNCEENIKISFDKNKQDSVDNAANKFPEVMQPCTLDVESS